jgi:hypothetical protein
VQALLLVGMAAGAARGRAALFRAPFNPASLNLAMLALACIGYLASDALPTAARCSRRPPAER